DLERLLVAAAIVVVNRNGHGEDAGMRVGVRAVKTGERGDAGRADAIDRGAAGAGRGWVAPIDGVGGLFARSAVRGVRVVEPWVADFADVGDAHRAIDDSALIADDGERRVDVVDRDVERLLIRQAVVVRRRHRHGVDAVVGEDVAAVEAGQRGDAGRADAID